jgi:hypothetical protein
VRPARARWAADDIVPALTRRVADLEAEVASNQIALDAEQRRLATYAESDRALDEAVADSYRGADAIVRRALAEADAALRRAIDERRALTKELERLREERVELQDEIASLRRGALIAVGQQPIEIQATPAFDLQTSVMEEMRALLLEIVRDIRTPSAVAPPIVEQVVAKTEIVTSAVLEVPVIEPIVAEVETALPPADAVVTKPVPIEPGEASVEHVDELVRRPASEPIVDEFVEELRAPGPLAPTDASDLRATLSEAVAPIVEEYVDELPVTEMAAPIDELEVEPAPPEPDPPVVDGPVFGPAESISFVQEDVEEFVRLEAPSANETIALNAIPAEPIVDEYVEELRPSEPTPSTESVAPPAESLEANVSEYVDEAASQLVEPIASEYFVPAEPAVDAAIDFTTAPPPFVLSAPPDARIDALWDAATPPAQSAEAASPATPEPAALISDEFIVDFSPTEIPEAYELPLELSPEPPPAEFLREPAIEFTPEPPAIFEPEPAVRPEPHHEAEPTPPSRLPFPELRVADERGLRQIQIVISPIHSFQRLLDTEARIRALSTVNAVHLRDFRNGIATFAVAVDEAISAAEFGAVIQMLQDLHLRLEGTTQTSVELRAEDDPPAS